jgi:hypothetical protein
MLGCGPYDSVACLLVAWAGVGCVQILSRGEPVGCCCACQLLKHPDVCAGQTVALRGSVCAAHAADTCTASCTDGFVDAGQTEQRVVVFC